MTKIIREKIDIDDKIFEGIYYEPIAILDLANKKYGADNLSINKAIKKTLEYLSELNLFQQIELRLNTLLIEEYKEYVNLTCRIDYWVNWKIQKHLPLIGFKGTYEEQINSMKTRYLKLARDILNQQDNDKLPESYSKTIFNKRMKNLYERCESNKYVLPDRKIFMEVLTESIDNGFKCNYCGIQLRLKGRVLSKNTKSYVVYEDLYTFDHIKPLSKGGTHDKDNICVCCKSCNTLKGDLDLGIFQEFIKSISHSLKYCLYAEASERDEFLSSRFEYYKNKIKILENEVTTLKIKNQKLSKINQELINSR